MYKNNNSDNDMLSLLFHKISSLSSIGHLMTDWYCVYDTDNKNQDVDDNLHDDNDDEDGKSSP